MYISACLRPIWAHFTQLTCPDTVLVWVSNCSSVERDAGVKRVVPFSLSTAFSPPCISLYTSVSGSVSPQLCFTLFSSLIFSFSVTFPSHFPSKFSFFPLSFQRQAFAASSAGRILFRCQIKKKKKSLASLPFCPNGGIKARRVVSFGGEWHRFLHWRTSRREASN